MHQFIAGQSQTGTSDRKLDIVDPSTGATVETVTLASAADVDLAVAAARSAFPEWSRATPGERSAVLSRFARLLAEQAEEFAVAESRQTGKPLRLAREFDIPGTIDNADFFAGAARNLGRQGHRRVLPGPHLQHPPRTHRRHRIDLALELPPADGRLEDPSGHRRGQHHRAQTGGNHPAHVSHVCPDPSAGRAAGRRGEHHRRRRPRSRRSTAAPPRRRHGLLHRLHHGGPDRPGSGRRPIPNGSIWSSAERRPSWSSRTPTSTPPPMAPSPAA